MKKIIGLTGSIGSGKTLAGEYLQKEYGAVPLRYSQILMDVLDRLALPADRKNLQTLGEVLRKNFGDDVLVNAFRQDLKRCKADVIVVDGIRYKNEVEMLREFPGSMLIYVSAPEKVRYERTVKRGEKGEGSKTFEEFLAAEKRETEKHLPGLRKLADAVIENTGTEKELRAKVDSAVAKRF